MRLCKDFTVVLQSVALMIRTIRLAQNNDLEVCDSILQNDNLLGRNRV